MTSRRPRVANPIDVIEAAYSLEGDELQWLERVGTALAPLLDRGHGWSGYFYDATTPIASWLDRSVRVDDDYRRTVMSMDPRLTSHTHHHFPEVLESAFAAIRLSGFTSIVEAAPGLAAYWQAHGFVDNIAFRTVEPGGRGVSFAAPQSKVRPIDRRTKLLWTRVSVHVAAARRLRDAIAIGGAAEEAVLSASGRVEHAEGDARDNDARTKLRDAVVRQERARGRARREDPELATEAWTALAAGRWSLIDRFESGGKRYLVARRNEHTLLDPRALTPRERAIANFVALGRSNKLIAYDLGLSESTVGTHLRGVMRKLGTRTRVELVAVVTKLLGDGLPSSK